MNDLYHKYLENILSRTWLGAHIVGQKIQLEKSQITDLYYENNLKEKIVIIGKTEKFYFILECFNEDDFYYANGLFNNTFKELLTGYKDKDKLLNGASIEKFMDAILFNKKLEQELSPKTIETVKKFKL